MKRITILIVFLLLAIHSAAFAADQIQISLAPAPFNPVAPRMGDHLTFRSVIINKGTSPAHGVVAWLGLVRVDPGKEQPVDLEDWSAQKAVSRGVVLPGEQIAVDWPMRLIQSGDYRVVVSAAERSAPGLVTSPFASFHVASKQVIESRRVIPVAIIMPLLIAVIAAGRFYRARRREHNRLMTSTSFSTTQSSGETDELNR